VRGFSQAGSLAAEAVNQAPIAGHPRKPGLDGIHAARDRFNVEYPCAHSTGKAAIENEHETSCRNAAEPICQLVERNRRGGEITRVSVMSYELVRFRPVP
jgi:hypothetical protein